VSRERDERLSPPYKNVESPRLDVLPLDLSGMIGCEGRKVREEIVADLLFVSSYGLDVDERACKLENIHANGWEKRTFDDGDLSAEKARSPAAARPGRDKWNRFKAVAQSRQSSAGLFRAKGSS